MKKSWTQLIITVAIILLSAVGLSLYGYTLRNQDASQQNIASANTSAIQTEINSNVFNGIPLRGQSILVQNLSTNSTVYEKNTDIALPLASLTKIMTAFVALQYLQPETTITFSNAAVAQTGDQGFTVGEQWPLQKLIPFMLTTSSNDAAYAIGEAIEKETGISCSDIMNTAAQNLGMTSLTFKNSTGLDIQKTSGITTSAKGNAKDIAQLLKLATEKYPNVFTTSSIPRAQLGNHKEPNTNILTESIPGFLASKTGYTEIAQGNLAFIVEIGPNQPYMVVILGSTFNGRFDDAKKIIAALYDAVAPSKNNL